METKNDGKAGKQKPEKVENLNHLRDIGIRMKLDEYMGQGKAVNVMQCHGSRAQLFKQKTANNQVLNKPLTSSETLMMNGGFPQLHSRSFFNPTVLAMNRRGNTINDAVREGELTRKITAPAIAAPGYAAIVLGTGGAVTGPYIAAGGTTLVTTANVTAVRLAGPTWKWWAAFMAWAGSEKGQVTLDWGLKIADDVLGDGSYGYNDLGTDIGKEYLKYLEEEYKRKNPPRPDTPPELWSNPKRTSPLLLTPLPLSPLEMENMKQLLKIQSQINKSYMGQPGTSTPELWSNPRK